MNILGYSHDGRAAIITLNNPPQNRLSLDLVAGIADAIQQIAANKNVRVVLIRATGPNFSFGGDITTWLDVPSEAIGAAVQDSLALFNTLEKLPVPIVAEVQGHCLGGGFELVLRTDIIVAAETASFAHPEQSLGVVTLLGGVQRVAERAGKARAMEWALTSERISAKRAFEAGVINAVVPDAELSATVQTWIERLVDGPTLAHAGHKELLRAWATHGIEAADKLLPSMAESLFTSEDARTGLQSAIGALAEGRQRPVLKFSGK